MFPDIKRSSKEKAKGLMKNNPLTPDDYIKQLYALPKLMHIKKNGNKIRHIQRILVFTATLTKLPKLLKICK